MAECPIRITNISPSEFLGESLFKLNTNYYNIDSGACQLGKDLQTLNAFIKSLTVRDSSTVDMSLSIAGYFLSGDIVDNSIGTAKLGIDIPQTSKTFLRNSKLGSLIDVDVSVLNQEYGLRWNGTKWVSTSLVDEFGADYLFDLRDTRIVNPKDKDILTYVSALSAWINSPDSSLSAVPDGDYDDINVSGFGQIWNIRSQRVGEIKIQSAAVQTAKIGNLQVISDHFEKNTIELDRLTFEVGERNTAINIGDDSGSDIATETKEGSKILFKSLKGTGGCIITSTNEEILITATQPPDPLPPTGDNQPGTGEAVFVGVIPTVNKFQFKTLKAGDNITIEESNNEITINRILGNLGLTLLDINADGAPLTEQQIITKVSLIYPPERFATNTICNVTVETPSTISTTNIPVSIDFTAVYTYKKWSEQTGYNDCCIRGICNRRNKRGCRWVVTGTISYMSLRWQDPGVAPIPSLIDPSTATQSQFPTPDITEKKSTSGFWGGYKNIIKTVPVDAAYQPKFALTSRTQKSYKVSNTKQWVVA